MNDSELEELLRSASAPERAPDFWEQFPKRITAKIHWQPQRITSTPDTHHTAHPFAWALGAGAICLVLVLSFALHRSQTRREVAGEFAQVKKCYREIEAMFPNQVQAIVFDDRGPRMILAEHADVPTSTPLYLRICGPRGCQQFVTFSGQQIRVNGDNCDVLQDAAGNVLLVGRQFVWSSGSLPRGTGKYRIEARVLETSS